MLSLVVSWIGLLIGIIFAWPYNGFFFPEQGFAYAIASTNIFFIIGIPLFWVAAFFLRMIFRRNILKPSMIKTGGFWALNIVSFGAIFSFLAFQFQTENQIQRSLSINNIENEIILLDFPQQHIPHGKIIMDQIQLSEKLLKSETVELDIVKADAMKITVYKSARGRDKVEAEMYANDINYNIVQTGNIFSIPADFILQKGEKWRGQKVHVKLSVPVGKKVQIPKNHPGQLINNLASEDTDLWTMTDDGLRPLHEKSLGNIEIGEQSKFNLFDEYKNFDQIEIDGPVKVHIEKNEDWSFRISGKESYTDKIAIKQVDNKIKVIGDFKNPDSPVRIYINMPSLKSLAVENTDDVKVKGFEESHMRISNVGNYDVKAYVNVDSLFLQQQGKNEIDIQGKGHFLSANLTAQSRLDAKQYFVEDMDIVQAEGSRVKL